MKSVLKLTITSPNKLRWLFWTVLLGLVFLYYGFLLTQSKNGGGGGFLGHVSALWEQRNSFELTFNSMLQHLMWGRFDVSPETVGLEGFYHDGRTYAYWGIFPALLRFPLLLWENGLAVNVTRFSCLVAVSAAITVKLLTLRRVSEVSGRSARWLIYALSIVFMFSGAQILFLKASLYQEVCLWAGMLGSLFVYFAIRGLVAGQFSRGNLCGMAVAAGLALHTRVSVAVGLYAALGLLIMLLTTRCLLRPAWNQASSEPPTDPASPSRTIFADLLPPLVILLTFAALAAFINVQRWGQPFMFANYDLYLMNESFPDRTARLDAYGLFNLLRLPLGVSYYFFPIWAARRSDGNLFFEGRGAEPSP